jgi:hypothetical protein
MKGRVMYVALLMTALVYRVFDDYSRVSASVASCKEMLCEEFSPRIQSEHIHTLTYFSPHVFPLRPLRTLETEGNGREIILALLCVCSL